jgi:hypothetical protein
MVYLSYNEKKFKEYPISICSIIYTLITLNQIIPVMRLNSRDSTTVEYGSFTIFNIVVIHTIFPLDKGLNILYSSSVSLINLIFLGFFLFKHSQSSLIMIAKKVYFDESAVLYIKNINALFFFSNSWLVMA